MITEALALRLVTDEMWSVVEPLIPPPVRRHQGGGRRRTDDRRALTALALFLTIDQAWKKADDAVLGVTAPTLYRRFNEYNEVGVWHALLGFGQKAHDPWPRDLAQAAMERAVRDANSPRNRRRNSGSERGNELPHC